MAATKETTARADSAELNIGRCTVKCAAEYARAMDTLAEASPTINGKILAGEINQPRAAIVEIAAQPMAERIKAVERMERDDHPEPEVKTKVYRSCGRALKLDCFVRRGPGRPPIYCRQCNAMAHVTNGGMSDVEPSCANTCRPSRTPLIRSGCLPSTSFFPRRPSVLLENARRAPSRWTLGCQ